VLLGASTTTPIAITELKATGSNALQLLHQNGLLTVDDSCAAGRRLSTISGQFMVAVAGSSPTGGSHAEIVFETNTDEVLSLEIYNSFGERISNVFKTKTQAGRYSNSVEISALASGVYHVVLQSATQVATAKMVVVR
ncbi:MAG TPA: T9SS type A sorting domain-containing protein, partial [Patescibacteria group bacterium]|nr:T9SS type A sorting domain-containing protein [Patescibacteria group bacterium]